MNESNEVIELTPSHENESRRSIQTMIVLGDHSNYRDEAAGDIS